MIMKTQQILLTFLVASSAACGNGDREADAYGNFEAEEIVISAKLPGELMVFEVEEGQSLKADEIVGLIDTTDLHLQRLEIKANIGAIRSQFGSIAAQIDVLKSSRNNLDREIERFTKLLSTKAATQKQVDDLEGQREVINKQMATIEAQNPNVAGQLNVAYAKISQIEERCTKSLITNPINGVVLNRISREHELVGPGSPLFTIADLSVLEFRAFISGKQLSSVKIGQEVMVEVDGLNGEMLSFPGQIKWISSQAEFTPKIIQTKEERVDMVYAIKVDVENDGRLKMGMPGELYFKESNAEDK